MEGLSLTTEEIRSLRVLHRHCKDRQLADVKETFGVVYTAAGMTDLLKRLDYVYKKPTLTPGQHPDAAVQQAFIRDYQRLKETKGKNDPIYFMDGVHPRHNPVAAYGWIKRGTDKTLESNTGRSRVNINGAVDIARLKVVALCVRIGETIPCRELE